MCHQDCISSVDDAKMILYLTDLIKNDTVDTTNLLYNVFHQVGKTRGINFMEKGVRLPTNSNGGHKLIGGGHYGGDDKKGGVCVQGSSGGGKKEGGHGWVGFENNVDRA